MAIALALVVLVVGAATFGLYELNVAPLASRTQSSQTTTPSGVSDYLSSSMNYTLSTPVLSTTGMGIVEIENGTTITPSTEGCSEWFGVTNSSDSGIFIPANTLVWVQLIYPANFTATVSAEFDLLSYPVTPDMNVTVGVYASNGTLVGNGTFSTQTGSLAGGYGQSPNGTLNEVVPLTSFGRSEVLPVVANLALSQGDHFIAAIISNEPLWVAGSVSGQPTWMVPQTYEATPGQFTSLPTSLPSPGLTLRFSLSVMGSVQWGCPV